MVPIDGVYPKNQKSRRDDTFIENGFTPLHTQPRRGGIVGSPKPIGQVNFNPKWGSVINCLNLEDLAKYFSQMRIHYVTPSGFSKCGNPNSYNHVIPSGLKAMSRILHAE
jgi:hypothetical protein